MSSMEDLLLTQEQISTAIEQLYSNFKKDGSDRKTPDYLKRRLDTLDSYWNEYQSNHIKLCGFGDKSSSYFTTNQFEQTGERYTHIRAAIQSYNTKPREEIRPSTPLIKPATPMLLPGTSTPDFSYQARGSNSKTDEMLRKQSSNFKAFEHSISNIDLDSITEKWEFDHLLRTIQSRWTTIDTLHWELDSETGKKGSEYESHFFKAEKRYNEVIKAINKKLWSVSHREKSTPKMEIPTFSGNYHQWSSFKDLFTETIHANPTLSSAQKMQFLKTKVKGEAERLIQHLTISSDNYAISWELLNHRYNNKRLILSSHFDLMLNIPAIQHLSLNHIKKIHDVTRESLNAIKNLGVNVESWDSLIIHLMCQKLDTETLSEYLSSVKDPKEIPKLEEFLSFLEKTFTTMETSRRKSETKPNQSSKNHKTFNTHFNMKQSSTGRSVSQPHSDKNVFTTKYYKCAVCKTNNHGIFHCNKFREMTPSIKRRTVEKLKLCENCLYCHYDNECISEKRCRECKQAHNTLLHEAFTQHDDEAGASTSSKANVSTPKQGQRPVVRSSHVSLQPELPEILLATAVILVETSDGSYIKMRALLDQGSQTSLITENAAQLLGLPRQKCQGVITGIGAKQANCKGAINIRCVSVSRTFEFSTDVLIMKSLIKNLPSHSFAKPDWSYLDHITLADPDFNISRPVDILFGADIYSMILLEGICRGEHNYSPIAQNTRLGWILSGCARTLQCNVILNNLDEIQRFWEIEDIAEESNLSLEDQECVQYYKSTTVRREDGSYEVRLPLKSDFDNNLGLSKNRAVAQFKSLERKFTKNQKMEESYKSFMKEYQSMGHMTSATTNAKSEFYLTHHGVERSESTTTKFRVVFNGSAKTSSGYSLNDVMKCGPNLQQDLQSLIIKWRQYQFAYTADIEMMFRRIWINNQDQKLQKIIWRDSEHEIIKDWELKTVTYGTKAAPFLAMMTLRQLASDERSNYQNSPAAEVLESSFYMDDLVHGTHQLEAAKQLREDLINLLKSGGFNLRKWKSNIPELSDAIMNKQESFNFKQPETSKTLGLSWNHQQDMFMFNSKIVSTTEQETKRSLLSDISKLFDPLGWLAPISTKLKLIFQRVWLSEIKWDDPLPEDILSEWIIIKTDIENINKLQVPRWLSTSERDIIELHGFCDASTKAYACVIYCKVKRGKQPIITLLVAKSRLVPCGKNITLPRLELSAAHLLSKLTLKVQQCLSSYQIKVHGWSDSMIVLGWLSGDPTRWKTFVANRVRDITITMPSTCWRYVKSEENPADCASRGLTASQLTKHNLWWQGPSWLPDFDGQGKQPEFITDQEIKKVRQVNVVTEQDLDNNIIHQLLTNHSTISKVIRIVSWMFRFITRDSKQAYLSISELNKSENLIIKQIQQFEFSKEIKNIKESKQVHPKSNISQLNPFIDENGILRVGGRLRNANLPFDMKHPIIISGSSRLAELLIDQAHKASYHGGARLTSAFLRRRYWLVGGNKIVKKKLRGCVRCRRHDPIKHEQIMGDLPAARTTPTRPFQHTGVDYTGFVDVKSSKGRGIKSTKGYISVFVCMVTKAVHLEIVSDLTSSAFLAALRRMAARRGTPSHIYSDNGTNFVGANKILNREYLDLQATLDDNFYTAITDMKIHWHFNAPVWPSAGGLWEAAVKSLKYHLKRVIGEQKLTFEEYVTLLAQLEACLNARPLCSLTEDPEDLEYLTPAHFLASGPTLTIIETERDQRTRWQLTQKIVQDVWKKWQSEYLSQLSTRSKWRQPKENININDVVIINDANLPSGKWALGRIVALHPGKDDYVRVVTLKTKNGEIKRPITKISKLPVNESETVEQDCKFQQKQEKISASASRDRSKKTKLYDFIFMLFMFLFMMATPVHSKYQISSLNISQGFYFDRITNIHLERDQWNLVIYYDMAPYWQGSDLLGKYINHLDGICNDQTKLKIAQCDIILLQLHHGLNELEHYNSILLGKQFTRSGRTRLPRGLINGVGFLANKLFGVLDQEFAEQYERDIETIRENEKHLSSLWKNQTSVVEGEFNLIKRVEASIDKHRKLFNQHLNNLEKSLNMQKDSLQLVSNSCDFTLSAVIAQGILMNLQNIQETIIDSLTNIYAGKFNFHLLTPEQLRDEMNTITGLLSKDMTLPLSNLQSDISKMYHLLTVKARASNKFIIFEVKIPLVSRDNFELYKLIPIPQQIENKMISLVPVSDYVAVNVQKDSYVPFTERDVHSCIEFDKDSHLCPIKQPIYQMRSEDNLCVKSQLTKQCQTTTSACKDSWIELNNVNTYLYFCCGQRSIRIICEHQITAEQLHKSGIMTISEECIIKSDTFTTYAHKEQSNTLRRESDVIQIEIPSINHIINLPIPTSTVENQSIYSDHQKYFEEIDRQIKQLKDGASEGVLTERVSYHDVHHYVVIYVVLFAGVVGIAILVWRRRRARAARPGAPAAAPSPPASAAEPDIELRTVSFEPPSVRCVSESAVNQCCVRSEVEDKSCSARFLNKASSPVFFRNKFDRTL